MLVGGLAPNQTNTPIRIEFDNLNLVRLDLQPTFFAGVQDVAPTLQALGTINLTPGQVFSIPLIATDPNGAPITITVDAKGSLPTGTLTGDNTLIFKPTPAQLGSYTFTLIANQNFISESLLLIDGNGTEQVFTVIKRNSNGDTEYGSATGNPSTFKRFATANIVNDILFERRLTDGTVYKFDSQKRIKTVTDRHGNTTTYKYENANGIISSITDAAQLTTTFVLNGNRIDTIIDPAGRVTQLNYDGGNLTSIKDPDATENKWEYDLSHLMTKSIDKLGKAGTDEYDELGRVKKAVKKDGSVVEFFSTYTPAMGRILTTNNGNSNTQTDTIEMLFPDPTISTPKLKSLDGNGNLTTLSFNRFGQVVTSVDDIGTKTNTYNSRGSLAQTSEYLNGVKHSTSYAYNENNQVTEIAYGEKLSSVPLAQYSNTSDRVSTAANVNFIDYFKGSIETTSAGVTTSIPTQFVVTSDKTGQIITKEINQDGLFATNGTESFSLRKELKVNTVDKLTVKKLLVGDFNGDNKQDLAIGYEQEVLNTRTNDFFYITNSLSYTSSAGIAIFKGQGNGKFEFDSKTIINPNALFDNYQFEIADLTAGDFNHDGYLDIVAANFIEPYAANWSGGNNYHLYMLVNDQRGKLLPAGANSNDNRKLKPFTSVDIKGVLTTAKDVSGKDLLVVASPNSQSTRITAYESDNNGKLRPILDRTVAGITQDIKAADLDGNGAGEIIVNGSQLYTIKISTGEVYTSAYTTQNTGFWSYMAVGDVNQDGRPDILVANDNSTLKVFLGKYDPVSGITKYDTAPQIYQGTSSPRGLIVTDLNSNAIPITNSDYLPDVIIGDAFAGLNIKLHIPASSNPNVVRKTFEYDPNFGQLTKSVDEEGRVTTYELNSVGDITKITKKKSPTDNINSTPDNVTTFTYIPGATSISKGLVDEVTDIDGHVTKNSYDTYGRLTNVQQGFAGDLKLVSTLKYEDAPGYDSKAGNVTEKIDGNGKITKYAYQSKTNRIETETYDPSLGVDQKTNYDYDAKGQLTSAINSDGYGQKFKYDALGRVNLTTNLTAKGTIIQQTKYDQAGNLIDIMNINNATEDSITGLYTNNIDGLNIHNVYDSRNRLTEVRNIDGSTTKYSYDTLNNLTKVIDAEEYETNYKYESTTSDSRMRQTEISKQVTKDSYLDALVTKTDYNNALQVTEVTDDNGKKTKYKYDGLGRQTQVTQELDIALDSGATEIFNKTTYYDNGNIKTITDGNNRTTTHTYNARNLKLTSTDALGTITTYTYDDAGNVKGMSTVNPNIPGAASITYGYDALNRRTKVIDALMGETNTTYDLSGNITRIEDANNQKTQYQYQLAERTTTTTDALGHKIEATYDALGRIATLTQKKALNSTEEDRVTTYTYDLVNNTTTIRRPEGVVETTKRDSVGNVKSVTTTVNGENRTTAYKHNGLNQVTLITAPPANTLVPANTQTFKYDKLGNLTSTTFTDNYTGEYHTTQYQTNNLGWKTKTTDAS